MERTVDGPFDQANRGKTLGEGYVFQLDRQTLDLVVEGGEVRASEDAVHVSARGVGELDVRVGALVRGLGAVVALGALGAVAVLLEGLVLSEEVVGILRFEGPDLVQVSTAI